MARRFDILINAKDNSSRVFRNAAAAMATYFSFTAIKTGIREAVTQAAEFEHQMASVSTMLKTNVGPTTAAFTDQVQEMSREFGQGKDVLSKGLFDILSAGVDAAKAIDVLTVSTKAAIGGATDTAQAVDGITTVLNAFKLEAEEATEVADLMFNTVREGKITFEELAQNISKFAPLAAAAGLDIKDMFAAIATAVKIEKPERAMTALTAAVVSATKQGKSLLTVVKDLQGADLAQILGEGFDKQAAQGIALLANNYEEFNKQLELSKDTIGLSEKAFEQMEKTAKTSIDKTTQNIKSAITDIGSMLNNSGILKFVEDVSVAVADSTAGLKLLSGFLAKVEKHGIVAAMRDVNGGKTATAKAAQQLTLDIGAGFGNVFKNAIGDALFDPKKKAAAIVEPNSHFKIITSKFFDDLDKEFKEFTRPDRTGTSKFFDDLDKEFKELTRPFGVGTERILKDILPTGPQQAFVTRGLSGLGTTMKPANETAKNTKATATAAQETNNKLDTIIGQNQQAMQNSTGLAPANLP